MANNVSIAKAKKGDTVLLCMFTGCKTGIKEIIACDKNTVTLNTRIGEAVFDRKTGKQIEPMPKNERYASYIVPDDGTFVPPQRKKKAKPAKKAAKAKTEPEEVEEDEDEEETPAPKKTKKAAPAKKSKKKPEPEPEEDDEDDDFDDDDFEEVE